VKRAITRHLNEGASEEEPGLNGQITAHHFRYGLGIQWGHVFAEAVL
jgi:hypothetical protein